MKDIRINEFEEVILLIIGILGEEAYALRIVKEYKEQSGKSYSIGSLHGTLERLSDKGLLVSKMGMPSAERGGRRKRVYEITAEGQQLLLESKKLRESLWTQYPGQGLAWNQFKSMLDAVLG